MARVEEELPKKKKGTNEPIERSDVWKVSHQTKKVDYINEEARRIVSSIFKIISFDISTTNWIIHNDKFNYAGWIDWYAR